MNNNNNNNNNNNTFRMHCFVFPAKRLRERAAVLRYMYIAFLVLFHQISLKMTE